MTLSGLLRLPLTLLALATLAMPVQAEAGCVGSVCAREMCQGSVCLPDASAVIGACTLRLCLPGPCSGITCIGTPSPSPCEPVQFGYSLDDWSVDTNCLISTGGLVPTPAANHVSWVLDLLPDPDLP